MVKEIIVCILWFIFITLLPILKLFGTINWNWWLVLIPMLLSLICALIGYVAVCMMFRGLEEYDPDGWD